MNIHVLMSNSMYGFAPPRVPINLENLMRKVFVVIHDGLQLVSI